MSDVSPKTMAPPSAVAAPASSHSHREGVSGDPVRCPFCDKELPASILSHAAPTANGSMGGEGAGVVSTTALMSSEGNADRADTSAAKAVISDDDIRKWSTLAGVPVDAPPKPKPEPPVLKAEVKAVPLLPPPPSGARTPKSARFGFFSKGKGKQDGDDEDSDSDGIISGYARLGAPESDDEGDDGYESEKEITFKPRPRDDDKPQTPVELTADKAETSGLAPPIALKETPGTGDAELRTVLREVLGRVQALSQSHAELQASHTTLLTSLKIARSNLVMAEANTEMLEAELRRAKATSANAARGHTPGARSSSDVPRLSVDARGSITSKQGWFGMKKPASPTESAMRISGDTVRSPIESEELRRLRSQLESQNSELEALKKGKKEIEAELEGLSQALFEEANKMVADERKRRAELEDTLNEVKGERAALRETVKVLGGRIQTPPPASTPHERTEEADNLDKHYAALRKSIHHVVDGPTPDVSEAGTPPGESEDRAESGGSDEERRDGETPVGESPGVQLPGAFVSAPVLETEPNPWAADRSPAPVV